MRIYYLITKSELGGAQVHLRDLMKSMLLDGHQVALMCYPGGWLVDEAQRMGAEFYPNIYFSNSYSPFSALRSIITVKKAVSSFSPDLVSLHSSGAGFLGRLAIRGKIPTIFTAHSWAFTEGAPLFRKIVALIAERFVVKYTSKIICVSDYDRNLAVKYNIAPETKLITVHNGVPISEEVDIGKTNSRVKIISIGRLAYPKRPDILIEAFKKLPEQFQQEAELHIIGDGPMKQALLKKIAKYRLERIVKVISATRYENIHGLLRSSDIFVLISKHEGLPMTILEAMNIGLPVIASSVGGIPEEIDNSCGILINNNDRKEITNALQELMSNKKRRITLGGAGRKKVGKLFSLTKFLQETKKVYEEVTR